MNMTFNSLVGSLLAPIHSNRATYTLIYDNAVPNTPTSDYTTENSRYCSLTSFDFVFISKFPNRFNGSTRSWCRSGRVCRDENGQERVVERRRKEI